MSGSRPSDDFRTVVERPDSPAASIADPAAADAFFDYDLPSTLIAQSPSPQRDEARLLVADRERGSIAHHVFHELDRFLNAGDLLVLNDTRVVAARMVGRRQATGGFWEGLFVRQLPDATWEILCQTRGRLTVGELIAVEPGPLLLQLLQKTPTKHWIVRPIISGQVASNAACYELLEQHGQPPLPPYIRRAALNLADCERYQTVYAQRPGAIAAPTAGLHFTQQVFDRLKRKGIGWTFVTLHVGLGTFQPVKSDDYREHHMHHEWGELSDGAVNAIASCRARGSRVVAVGTTTVRLLEGVASSGPLRPWSGEIGIYIYPPYSFRVVDALVTNFHLPRSTLLLLVSALAGTALTTRAYTEAIANGYRFYSYGDAMLVL